MNERLAANVHLQRASLGAYVDGHVPPIPAGRSAVVLTGSGRIGHYVVRVRDRQGRLHEYDSIREGHQRPSDANCARFALRMTLALARHPDVRPPVVFRYA